MDGNPTMATTTVFDYRAVIQFCPLAFDRSFWKYGTFNAALTTGRARMYTVPLQDLYAAGLLLFHELFHLVELQMKDYACSYL